ncbi:MAG: TonB C-terminal domain-containing protein [Deltaproteobacteria bacterium]|nr:TonB C-terminal domain-containing protein [Deltaproteobacteria bacterium]
MTFTLNTDISYLRFLILSLILHVLVSFLFFFWSAQNQETKPPETQITWVNLGSPLSIEKTSGVAEVKGKENKEEIKTVPQQKVQPQLPKEAHPPKKIVTPKEIVTLNPKKIKEENKKNTQTNEKNKTVRQDNQIQNALAKITGDLANEQKAQAGGGNTTGQGTAAGTAGGSNSECSVYAGQVKQRILNNWAKMKGETKPARPPVATIRISSSGQVSAVSWKQKSGDLAWDNSAQKAIQSTNFPPLPQNCAIALSQGVVVQFGR